MVITYLQELLNGVTTTLIANCLAAVLSLVLGTIMGVLTYAGHPYCRMPILAFVELMRGVPILVLLFILYYVGPEYGIVLDSMTAGVVGLGLYNAAYVSEIVRSCLKAIPKGQIEASRALGLSRSREFFRILLPQMVVISIPSLCNQYITMVKDSAVLSILTVNDLMSAAKSIVSQTFDYIGPFLLITVFYFVLSSFVAWLGNRAERRLGVYLR